MAAARSPQEVFGHPFHQAPRPDAAGDLGPQDHHLRGRHPVPGVGAEGGGKRIQHAVDTFVLRDGMILVQTVRHSSQPAR
jgi:hypothetical protein